MCSTAAIDPALDLAPVVERLSGRIVRRLEPIGGGRNNCLLRADTDRGPIAVKHYSKDRTEHRGRLAVEYEALAFLVGGGVDTVPRPLARDDDHQLALYEWIDGDRIEEPDAAAIDAAVATLGNIHRLNAIGRAGGWLRAASASILCPAEAAQQICSRRAQFAKVAAETPELAAFLAEFDALGPRVFDWAGERAGRMGIAWEAPLSREHRTLSPSDFGFHNALRRHDGRVIFFDFEYFGWDDPAKLCNDFRIHPGMDLPEPLASRFAAGVYALYGCDDPGFGARFRLMYPLCALCWCLIMLNPFLSIDRRGGGSAYLGENAAGVLNHQLAKARLLLARVGNFMTWEP